jgi:hypothetical protein
MKTKLRLLPLLLTALALFSLTSAQAHGTNWVTTLADSGAGSLRQVLLSAIDGDTVAFATNGTITLTSGELVITNNLSISGPSATNLAISGNNSSRVFNIASSNVVVTMDDMTICNGKAANGINAPLYGSPGSGSDGGGIYNLGNLTLKRCILKNNTAGAGGTGYELGGDGGDGGTGGAVFNAGTLAVVSSTVASNAAGWGGNAGQTYGYSQARGAGGHGGHGGGIYNTGILSIVSSTLAYNLTGVGGIGVGTQEMLPSGSGGNGGNGGGVYNAGTLSVGSSTLAFNRTGAGGLGANDADSGYENIAGGDGGHGGHGGGIYNIGTLSVASSTVAANSTGAGGKGGDASWTTFWFVGYDQGGDGGDGGDGGGIYSGGIVAIIHNTLVVANAVGARGLYGMQGYLLEGTTKIYGPSCGRDGSWGRDPDLSGSFTSQGYNLVGITGNSTGLVNGVNNNLVGTSVAPINPLLGSLTNNGGITMTMALLPGSPALDAGDDTLTGTDQRGFPRKSGAHVDIGAFEESTTIAVGLASNPNPSNGVITVTLTPTLSWTPGANALSHLVFFGVNSNSVAMATTNSPEFKGTQTATDYAPGTLASSGRYFWRVDEVGASSSTNGTTWTFATLENPSDKPQISCSYNGNFSVSIPSQRGQAYRVEWSDSLSPVDWQFFSNNIPGTGSAIVIPDPGTSSATQRFYRVLILSP